MDIDKDYAPPGLRWGLFLHDWPNGSWHAEIVPAAEQTDVPASFLADTQDFVRLTVQYGEPGHPDVVVLREIPRKIKLKNKTADFERNPENWSKLCTQALGRALKKAGYPDKMPALQAIVHWRKRAQELQLLAKGIVPRELAAPAPGEPTSLDAALANSAGRSAEDDDEHLGDPDEQIEDAVLVHPGDADYSPPIGAGTGPAWPADVAELLGMVPADKIGDFDRFLAERNITPNSSSDGELRLVRAFLAPLVRHKTPPGPSAPSTPPAPPAAPDGTQTPQPAESELSAEAGTEPPDAAALLATLDSLADDRAADIEAQLHDEGIELDVNMPADHRARLFELLLAAKPAS